MYCIRCFSACCSLDVSQVSLCLSVIVAASSLIFRHPRETPRARNTSDTWSSPRSIRLVPHSAIPLFPSLYRTPYVNRSARYLKRHDTKNVLHSMLVNMPSSEDIAAAKLQTGSWKSTKVRGSKCHTTTLCNNIGRPRSDGKHCMT